MAIGSETRVALWLGSMAHISSQTDHNDRERSDQPRLRSAACSSEHRAFYVPIDNQGVGRSCGWLGGRAETPAVPGDRGRLKEARTPA